MSGREIQGPPPTPPKLRTALPETGPVRCPRCDERVGVVRYLYHDVDVDFDHHTGEIIGGHFITETLARPLRDHNPVLVLPVGFVLDENGRWVLPPKRAERIAAGLPAVKGGLPLVKGEPGITSLSRAGWTAGRDGWGDPIVVCPKCGAPFVVTGSTFIDEPLLVSTE